MTLSDSVLWLLITIVLYLLEFTTVSHHPALVTVDSYTLALINILVESSHKCIPFFVQSLIRSLQVGLKRPRGLKRPVISGIGFGLKLGIHPLVFLLRSRSMLSLIIYKSEIHRLRRGQDRILRRNLVSSFGQKKKLSFWSIE